jgi:hypothetical protein
MDRRASPLVGNSSLDAALTDIRCGSMSLASVSFDVRVAGQGFGRLPHCEPVGPGYRWEVSSATMSAADRGCLTRATL